MRSISRFHVCAVVCKLLTVVAEIKPAKDIIEEMVRLAVETLQANHAMIQKNSKL